MSKHLSVVTEETKAARRKVHAKIADALEGSGRDVLASMRKALAKKLDDGDVSSNAIASAYKELRELDRLIRLMDATDEREGNKSGPTEDEAWTAV
jgi:hypothetical protein